MKKTKRNKQIVLLRDRGMTFSEIGRKYKIAKQTARKIYLQEKYPQFYKCDNCGSVGNVRLNEVMFENRKLQLCGKCLLKVGKNKKLK